MAALLANGTTAASSADFTLTGEASTLFLVAATSQIPDSAALIEIKSAARWPGLTPPTLAECEAFVAGVALEVPPEPELLA